MAYSTSPEESQATNLLINAVANHADYESTKDTDRATDITARDLSSGRHGNEDDQSAEDSGRRLNPIQIATLAVLMSGSISSAMFSSLLAPFFPTEATRKGTTLYEVGLIFGCYQLLQFLMSPVFGSHMRNLGSKFLFVSGNFVVSGCAILFGLLEWSPPGYVYVVMCFLVRALEAVGSAAQLTATYTLGSLTFPRRISTIMGLLQASTCVGLVAGPPIGGLLYSRAGFYLPFLVTGSVFMFFSVISLIILPSDKDEQPIRAGNMFAALRLLRQPIVLLVGYMVVIGQATLGFIDVTLAEYLNTIEPGVSEVYVGLIFLMPAGLVVMIAPLLGFLTDRYKVLRRPFMVIGCFLGAAGFLITGPSPLLTFLPRQSICLVIIGLMTSALGWSCLMLTYQEFLTASEHLGFPDSLETQGMVSGLNGAFNSLGAFLGPTLGGILYEKLHFRWASTIVALAVMLSGVLLLVFMIAEKIRHRLAGRGHHRRNVIS